MVRSKYGMLEIFRAAFARVEAVIMMRHLNKKFKAMSQDPYLDFFKDEQDTMYFEVRKHVDLDYFQKMIRYANIIKGNNCLHIDFYFCFDRRKPEEE